MLIVDIYRTVSEWPTIMDCDQELDLIGLVTLEGDDNLISDFETLEKVLDILYESHAGGGVFGVSEKNIEYYTAFASFLYELALNGQKSGKLADKQVAYLHSIADAIACTFE